MQKMKYQVEFLTPAFLGNARQDGQWRTPPFKALLRQWWRVVWAARHGFPEDFAAMRRDEGRLFGNAWIDGDFRKSAVRMRLSKWTTGSLTRNQWGNQELDGKIQHPEVNQPVGPLLYLGYGPLKVDPIKKPGGRREYATSLKGNAAIQAGEAADLSIAAPESDVADIRSALALMDAYGTVGGRSRNGWGSFAVEPSNGTPGPDVARTAPPADEGNAVRRCIRPWGEALKLDWPHAIGTDDTGPLVWQTKKMYGDWRDLMRDLAILKIGLRTMFVFPPNARPPHPQPLDRHWLSYPITRHGTRQWNRNARLPNSLRFKVRQDPADPKRLRGVIFHVPCRPPADFRPDMRAIEKVWRTTHHFLDKKPSLDRLTLERSPE